MLIMWELQASSYAQDPETFTPTLCLESAEANEFERVF